MAKSASHFQIHAFSILHSADGICFFYFIPNIKMGWIQATHDLNQTDEETGQVESSCTGKLVDGVILETLCQNDVNSTSQCHCYVVATSCWCHFRRLSIGCISVSMKDGCELASFLGKVDSSGGVSSIYNNGKITSLGRRCDDKLILFWFVLTVYLLLRAEAKCTSEKNEPREANSTSRRRKNLAVE